MRVRKKPNLDLRLDACRTFLIEEPEQKLGLAHTLFQNPQNPIYVEIGCGKGKFIRAHAAAHPNINFIAIEKVGDVLVMAVEQAQAEALPNLLFLCMDAKDLLKFFAKGQVARLYLNFSDPWKKTKQGKRRLTHHEFLRLYEQLLPPGGELQFKTDNHPLFEFSVGELQREHWVLRELTYDLHENGNPSWNIMTEYEESWLGKGAHIHRLVAVKEQPASEQEGPC